MFHAEVGFVSDLLTRNASGTEWFWPVMNLKLLVISGTYCNAIFNKFAFSLIGQYFVDFQDGVDTLAAFISLDVAVRLDIFGLFLVLKLIIFDRDELIEIE